MDLYNYSLQAHYLFAQVLHPLRPPCSIPAVVYTPLRYIMITLVSIDFLSIVSNSTFGGGSLGRVIASVNTNGLAVARLGHCYVIYLCVRLLIFTRSTPPTLFLLRTALYSIDRPFCESPRAHFCRERHGARIC